jgi:ADP-ribose pyrophosphatase YjhB (NUDIX family)
MSDYITSIRRKVGTDRLLLPTTACLVLRDRREVLLEHRADNGRWGVPGGIMEIGETVTESARRELFEESGLMAGSLLLFGIYSGPSYEGIYPNGDRTAVVQSVFLVESFSGELTPCDEALDLRFFPIDSLPDLLTPHHAVPLGHLQDYLRGKLTVPVVL